MKISATSTNRKVGVGDECGKLELRAQYPTEAVLLARLYRYLLLGDDLTLSDWLDKRIEKIERYEERLRPVELVHHRAGELAQGKDR